MIIEPDGVHSPLPLEGHWENARWEAWWKGFLCMPPHRAGEASVECFTESCDDSSVAAARSMLRGQFFLTVRRKDQGPWQAFIDTSGMFYAFCSTDRISTSFIDLMRAEGLKARDADPSALVEFLTFGYVHQGRSLFDEILRISPDEIVTLVPAPSDPGRRGLSLTSQQVPVPAIDQPPGLEPQALFDGLASSLALERLSVDLTGGVDSRTVAVLADHANLEFETAIAGVATSRDVRLGAGWRRLCTIRIACPCIVSTSLSPTCRVSSVLAMASMTCSTSIGTIRISGGGPSAGSRWLSAGWAVSFFEIFLGYTTFPFTTATTRTWHGW